MENTLEFLISAPVAVFAELISYWESEYLQHHDMFLIDLNIAQQYTCKFPRNKNQLNDNALAPFTLA